MKRVLWIASLLCLVLSLGACKSTGQATSGTAAQSSEATLPTITQLLVGTFRLEGSAQAVNAEQAAELLPLWKAYRALSNNDSAAAQEVAALTKQLEQTMTSQQREALAALKLTFQDIATVAQQQGVDLAATQGQRASSSSAMSGNTTTKAASGGAPAGVPAGPMPDGGGGPMPEGGAAPAGQSATTSSSARSAAGAASPATSALLDALIKLLEARLTTG